MKRFIMLLITGMVALMLSACGDNASQKPEATTDAVVVEQTQPAADVTVDAEKPAEKSADAPTEAPAAE